MEELRTRIIVSLFGLMGLSPLVLGCFGAGVPARAPSAEDLVLPGLPRGLPAAPGGAASLPHAASITPRKARRALHVFGSQLCIDIAGRPLARRFYEQQGEFALSFESHDERDAIEQVISSKADLALVSVELADFERQYGVEEKTYAYLLPTLVVHPSNPVGNLLLEQVRPLLSGKLGSWHDLGGAMGTLQGYLAGPESLVRGQELTMMPGDRFLAGWPMLSPGEVRHKVGQDPLALGVTHLAASDSSMRTLAIDGVYPSVQSFRDGRYPFGLAFRVIFRSSREADVEAFLDFLSSEAGLDSLADSLILPQ